MTDEGLHDWRKRIKYHWMHLQLLRDVWPAPVKARLKDAKTLSDTIGDDHDLVVLRDLVIGATGDDIASDIERSLLLALIGQRQAELRADALRLGAHLCDREADWFAARVALVWRDAIDGGLTGERPGQESRQPELIA